MDDPRVEQLWEQVLSRWQEEAAHALFIEHCRATRQLGQAARRYREEIRRSGAYREDATRAETAEKRLKGITTLALLELEESRLPREEVPPATRFVRWLAVVVLAAVIGASLFFLLRR